MRPGGLVVAGCLALATMSAGVEAEPSPAMAPAAAPAPPVIGLGFWIAKGGIEVTDVEPGSAAEKAGIVVGMLITKVNGTALGDLSVDEVERLVGGLEGEIVFVIREKGEVRLRKAPISLAGR